MSKTYTLTAEQRAAKNEKARAARIAKKALAAIVEAQAAESAPATEEPKTEEPKAGKGLAAAKAASKRPSKAKVTKAAEAAPVEGDSLDRRAAQADAAARATRAAGQPPVVTEAAGFNVLTAEQRAAWYEAATGRDADKAVDLLGACLKAFKAGKRPPETTSSGAVVKRSTVKKGAALPKGDIVSQLTGARTAEARPRGLLSAPAPDAELKVAEDTSRIRSGFTHEMLGVALKLAKKSPKGTFTRAQLFAKFPEVSRAKLTDAFYCGTERGVYVPA